jgi:hypothetical protein
MSRQPIGERLLGGACLLAGLGDVLELAHFDHDDLIGYQRAGLRQTGGLLEVGGLDHDKPADGFLGLYKRAIAVDITRTHILALIVKGAGIQEIPGLHHVFDPLADLPGIPDKVFVGLAGPNRQVLSDKEQKFLHTLALL